MRVTCPNCRQTTTAPPEMYGGRIVCPHCDGTVNVPLAGPTPEALRGPRVLGTPNSGSQPLLWIGLSVGAAAAVVVVVIVLMNRGEELGGRIGQSRIDTAKAQMKVIERACQTYKLKYGDWPESLEVLAQMQPDGQPPFMEAEKILDPWGQPYQYDPSGDNNRGLNPDIWFIDPDGNMIGNWMAVR